MAQRMIDPAALAELRSLFPDVCAPQTGRGAIASSYGDTVRPFLGKKSVTRRFSHCAGALL